MEHDFIMLAFGHVGNVPHETLRQLRSFGELCSMPPSSKQEPQSWHEAPGAHVGPRRSLLICRKSWASKTCSGICKDSRRKNRLADLVARRDRRKVIDGA